MNSGIFWKHQLIEKINCTLTTTFDNYTYIVRTKKAQVYLLFIYVYCYDRYTYDYDILKIIDMYFPIILWKKKSNQNWDVEWLKIILNLLKNVFSWSVSSLYKNCPILLLLRQLKNTFLRTKNMHIHEPFWIQNRKK